MVQVAECERMSKGQSRVSYTRRIMELVGNISKQKEGIAMILADTQQVQREINQLSGKLERVFIITDEQIFKVRVVTEACFLLCGNWACCGHSLSGTVG